MTSCPPWCVEAHDDGERRHLAELTDVPVRVDGTTEHLPTLFLNLRQGPGDDRPLIHLDLDEKPVARLQRAEAVALARRLFGLAELAGE